MTRLTSTLPDDALTMGDWLGDLGYATAAFGKMHFNAGSHGDDRHGFAARLDTDDWGRLAPRPAPRGGATTSASGGRFRESHPPSGSTPKCGRSACPTRRWKSSFYVQAATKFLDVHKV